jgi:hypothetical protein
MKDARKFYYSVMQGWYAVEKTAADAGHYTQEQMEWRKANKHKFEEATEIYQIALLESLHSESKMLRWLTVALIVLSMALTAFALPSFIQYLRLIHWIS